MKGRKLDPEDRQKVLQKNWYLPVTVCDVTSQDAGILICMARDPQILPFEID
jgi:hypothetical protein